MALIVSTLLLQATNILRIVSLYFVRRDNIEYYDLVHENLWPVVLSLDVALIAVICFWMFQKQKSRT